MTWQRKWDLGRHAQHQAIPEVAALIERAAAKLGVTIELDPGTPSYWHEDHAVCMPPMAAFESAAAYYHVALHELAHATASDLVRSTVPEIEECTAELAAMMLGDLVGNPYDRDNARAYLETWAKGSDAVIETAAAFADRVVDLLWEPAREHAA